MLALPSLISLAYAVVSSSFNLTSRQVAAPRTSISSQPGPGISGNTSAYIQDLLHRWSIPGAVVAYISAQKDGVVPFGTRDVVGSKVTNETYFAIASNTKLFTAVAINLLIEDNVTLSNGCSLRLTSRLIDIIPGFSMKNASLAEELRLIDVLSMRSGLPQHIIAISPDDNPLTAAASTAHLSVNTAGGADGTYQYSSHNYEILASIPSLLVNESIDAYVQECIFTRLGMGASFNATHVATGGRHRSQGFLRGAPDLIKCQGAIIANGTSAITDKACLGELEAFDYWTETASAGIYGGAGVNLRGVDMVKWIRELITPHILPSAAIDRVKTAVPYDNTAAPRNASALVELVGYQSGTIATWYRGHKVYIHDGALPGATSYLAWSPDAGAGVFVAANEDLISMYANEVIANTVLDELLGLDRYPWEETVVKALQGADSASSPFSPAAGNGTATNPAPRPAPTGYAGATFSDAAYGNFTLVPLNLTSPSAWASAGIPGDWFVQAIAAPLSFNLSAPAYYASYNHSIVSHLVFTHHDGPLYNYTAIFTRPRLAPDGSRNGTTAKTYGLGPAVFAEGGIGMFGNFALQSASLPLAPVVETGVKDAAPVFFAGLGTAATAAV